MIYNFSSMNNNIEQNPKLKDFGFISFQFWMYKDVKFLLKFENFLIYKPDNFVKFFVSSRI